MSRSRSRPRRGFGDLGLQPELPPVGPELRVAARGARHLHRDMINNRVSVDTIPGLKKTRSKLQKAARKIRKAGTRGAKKVQSFFTGKR